MPRAGVAAGRPLSPDEGQARSWADLLALADDGDPGVRHEESTVQVVLAVDADADPWGDDDVLVDDGPMDRGVATDIDEVEQDAVGDLRVAVDLHTGESTEWVTCPPLITTPGETAESIASPTRPFDPKTNLAGG